MNDVPLSAAAAALAGGRTVNLGAFAIRSIETSKPGNADRIIISSSRAAALGLGNRREWTPGEPVCVLKSDWIDAKTGRSLADPAQDFDRFLAGPLEVVPIDDREAARAAIRLSRISGLLPALWVVDPDDDSLSIGPEAIFASEGVTLAARAKLPVDDIGEAQVAVFREDVTGDEHVALLFGSWSGHPPLVRLHSECLTGDVFASLKCDCGPQLKEALRLLAANTDGGVLLYLRQEGRGIGLANKIRAYALQDRGLDTVEANRRLGFADDERDYSIAAAMLSALGIDKARLLTNNPAKMQGLAEAGVEVVERVAHHMPTNPHNADYLATKRRKSGHLD